MMRVKISQAFRTMTHAVAEGDVGKETEVAPEVGCEWVQAGYAAAVDAAGKEMVAAAAQRSGPKPTAASSTPEASMTQPATAEATAGLSKMKKAQLLAECAKRGIDASESDSRDTLMAKLQ